MPHGRYVAFEMGTDIPHTCATKVVAGMGGWKSVARTAITPDQWLAIASVDPARPSVASSDTHDAGATPRKDYTASRLAIQAATQPVTAAAQPAKLDPGAWKSRRRQRVAELLADLPFDDVSTCRVTREPAPLPVVDQVRYALSPPDRVIAERGVFETLGDLDAALQFPTGDLQALIAEDPDETHVELIAGVASGTTIVDAERTISCVDSAGVFLSGEDRPALIVDSPGQVVTLRNVTLNADSRYGTVLVIDGHLRLENCLVSGRTGIVLGPGAESLEIIDSRIVCPMGGCGIITATDAMVTLDRVWIGVHKGIGILDLADGLAGIETASVRVVGDDVIALHTPYRP